MHYLWQHTRFTLSEGKVNYLSKRQNAKWCNSCENAISRAGCNFSQFRLWQTSVDGAMRILQGSFVFVRNNVLSVKFVPCNVIEKNAETFLLQFYKGSIIYHKWGQNAVFKGHNCAFACTVCSSMKNTRVQARRSRIACQFSTVIISAIIFIPLGYGTCYQGYHIKQSSMYSSSFHIL